MTSLLVMSPWRLNSFRCWMSVPWEGEAGVSGLRAPGALRVRRPGGRADPVPVSRGGSACAPPPHAELRSTCPRAPAAGPERRRGRAGPPTGARRPAGCRRAPGHQQRGVEVIERPVRMNSEGRPGPRTVGHLRNSHWEPQPRAAGRPEQRQDETVPRTQSRCRVCSPAGLGPERGDTAAERAHETPLSARASVPRDPPPAHGLLFSL